VNQVYFCYIMKLRQPCYYCQLFLDPEFTCVTWPTNISLISPQIARELYLPPMAWGPPQQPFFNQLFYYTPVRPTFLIGIGGDTLGAAVATPPIFTKILLGYPNTCISGIDYWGTGGDALSFQPPQMEVSHSLLLLLRCHTIRAVVAISVPTN
jgi:hypothetical protein